MIHDIDPVIFSVGILSIRYYGLIYMAGFVSGYIFLKYAAAKKNIVQLDKKGLDDLIFLSVFFVVLGSRLFEVLFYEPGYYFSNPLKIFAIWEGGLSFHGGLTGSIALALYFTRKKKMPFFQLTDLLAIPAAFALFLGRIANFINGELYGFPVENQVNPPWYAVKFVKTDPLQLYRIPTQILESLKNLIIFIVLFLIWKYAKNLKRSVLSWLFILLYGTFRFFIEYFKDVHQNQLFGLSTGQLLCIPMIAAALIGLWMAFKKPALQS